MRSDEEKENHIYGTSAIQRNASQEEHSEQGASSKRILKPLRDLTAMQNKSIFIN